MTNIYQIILDGKSENDVKEIFEILEKLKTKYNFSFFLFGASARNYWLKDLSKKPRT